MTNIAVEFTNARKVYFPNSPKQSVALEGLSLQVNEGEFFGLLGHNGAGKSTAINIMSGAAKISSGDVKILGKSIVNEPLLAKKFLGVVCQELIADSFFDLRTMLNIQCKLSGVVPDKSWIDLLLEKLALKDHTKKTTRELSGGMKRRMMIARALVHKPKVVVLDEPTAGVDVELRRSMWEFIKELHLAGTTIILTTHYLEEAEQFCERLAILKAGKLVTLKTQKELMSLGGTPKVVAKFSKGVSLDAFEQVLKNLGGFVLFDKFHNQFKIGFEFDDKEPVSLTAAHAKLNEALNQIGMSPESLDVEKPSLEEVFLKLSS
jgi:ABC-2 type transport system ATP-binding protein